MGIAVKWVKLVINRVELGEIGENEGEIGGNAGEIGCGKWCVMGV